jgi:hypothetical protein
VSSQNKYIYVRSLAIDYLLERFRMDDEVRIVYIYFDYTTKQTQTRASITANIMKQLVSQCDIPDELGCAYDEAIQIASGPNIALLHCILELLSAKYRIYAVFDAIDECDEDHQRDIFTLFTKLTESNCRLLISVRLQFQSFLGFLTTAQTIVISANKRDLENYVKFRLGAAKNRNKNLETQCVALAEKAEGM